MEDPLPQLVGFESDVFLLLEKRSLFYSAKWKKERIALSTELLEFSPKPQVVLRFQGILHVVLRAFVPPSATDASASTDKQKLLLEVRSMDDVRKSWVYQTAAKTTPVELYVDTESTREQILAFVNHPHAQSRNPSLPYAVPIVAAIPQHLSSSSNSSSRETPTTNAKALIDDSFQALAEAQAMREQPGASIPMVVERYNAAALGFERAASLVPDERTRELFQERRLEIQKVVRGLEEQVHVQNQQPSAAVSILMGITGMGFPEPPKPPASPAADSAHASSSCAGAAPLSPPPTASTTLGLDERLENLRKFAAQQEVERAQRERKPVSDDLRLRLQALKNETATTPSVNSLEERFQRLRGLPPNPNASQPRSGGDDEEDAGRANCVARQSSVDRIIQQVQDELALGIVDGTGHPASSDKSDAAFSESESDDDDDEEDGRDSESGSDDDDDNGHNANDEIAKKSPSWRDRETFIEQQHALRKYPLHQAKSPAMNKMMDHESGRILTVLEETVAVLEVIATLPDSSSSSDGAFVDAKRLLSDPVVETLEQHFQIETSLLGTAQAARWYGQDNVAADEEEERPEVEEECWSSDDAVLFPKSLHSVVRCIMQDKAARDTLRKASATTVSLAFAKFTQTWTELSINVDHVFSTSTEQDERTALNLRESKIRLREVEDDRKQVVFELAKEREARVAMNGKYSKIISGLQEQLTDTQRTAGEALAATERSREQELHAALSSFENQKTGANEKLLAVMRTDTRVSDENKHFEADERKRKQRVGTDLRELLQKYDDEMALVDAAIAQEQAELQRIEEATASLETYFARIDEDRSNQLDELRAIDEAARRKRQRELNLFRFIQRLQAVVRGFLVRRQYRLQLLAQKKKRKSKRKPSKAKKKLPSSAATSLRKTSAKSVKKTASGSSGKSPLKPRRP